MSRQSERDEFIAAMAREGLPLPVTQALLRASVTLHRIAELECSSEAADRDRVPCPGQGKDSRDPGSCLCKECGSYNYGDQTTAAQSHGTVPRIALQEARLTAKLTALVGKHPGFGLSFQGDPRGPSIRVHVPSGQSEEWGGVAVRRAVLRPRPGPLCGRVRH